MATRKPGGSLGDLVAAYADGRHAQERAAEAETEAARTRAMCRVDEAVLAPASLLGTAWNGAGVGIEPTLAKVLAAQEDPIAALATVVAAAGAPAVRRQQQVGPCVPARDVEPWMVEVLGLRCRIERVFGRYLIEAVEPGGAA